MTSFLFFSRYNTENKIFLQKHLDLWRGDGGEVVEISAEVMAFFHRQKDHSSFVNLVFPWQCMKGKWRSVIPFWHAKRHDILLHDKIPHTDLTSELCPLKSFSRIRTEQVDLDNLRLFLPEISLLLFLFKEIHTFIQHKMHSLIKSDS